MASCSHAGLAPVSPWHMRPSTSYLQAIEGFPVVKIASHQSQTISVVSEQLSSRFRLRRPCQDHYVTLGYVSKATSEARARRPLILFFLLNCTLDPYRSTEVVNGIMCGLIAILALRQSKLRANTFSRIDASLAQIKHRGPDSLGKWISPNGHIGEKKSRKVLL